MSVPYAKRRFLQPNPEVAREIARLDAKRDCQRIVHLLTAYEFPWDFQRALELALFYTYGSASVARVLNATGQFSKSGQKRYDDTRLLMTHIMDSGWDGDFGRRALERVNKSHGHYRIAADDFLFVLWTFIEFPIRWTTNYGPRPMTPHEQQAWFHFWAGLGERMHIPGIPDSKAAFDHWVADYKRRTFTPNDDSAQVAAATIAIFEGWLPPPLRGKASPVIYSLFDDDLPFLNAVKAPVPPRYLRPLLEKALRAYARLRRQVVTGPYPVLPDSPRNRTYGNRPYRIEDLRPDSLGKKEAREG